MFDSNETWLSMRADVALLLHIKPSEVDEMPLQDIYSVMARHNANMQIQNRLNRMRSKRR